MNFFFYLKKKKKYSNLICCFIFLPLKFTHWHFLLLKMVQLLMANIFRIRTIRFLINFFINPVLRMALMYYKVSIFLNNSIYKFLFDIFWILLSKISLLIINWRYKITSKAISLLCKIIIFQWNITTIISHTFYTLTWFQLLNFTFLQIGIRMYINPTCFNIQHLFSRNLLLLILKLLHTTYLLLDLVLFLINKVRIIIIQVFLIYFKKRLYIIIIVSLFLKFTILKNISIRR